MTKWINHVAIAAPANGTTSHTVDPNGGTVVAGTNFTPTAGRVLVCIASGSMTSTPTDGAWVEFQAVVSSSGLYVWQRDVAVGGDTITLNHNTSNYPVLVEFFEFARGSNVYRVNSHINHAYNNENSYLGGSGGPPDLYGTDLMFAVRSQVGQASAVTFTTSLQGGHPPVTVTDLVDTCVTGAGTGYGYSIVYSEEYLFTEWHPLVTSSNTVASESLSFSMHAAELGDVPAASWTNHVTIAVPRNGTTTHSINPASSGTVVAGAAFTPTAGRFLVCVVESPATVSGTGWTVEASAVNVSALYALSKTAAGGDTITATMGASNYPAIFHILEFPAGTTWVTDNTATAVGTSSASPSLSGLGGPSTAIAVRGSVESNTSGTCFSAWTGATELVDHVMLKDVTDGCYLTVAYTEYSMATTFAPTASMSGSTAGPASLETITFAVKGPVPWLNYTAVASARNGTTGHTFTPASDTPVAGSAFTPTAGRFLVAVAVSPGTATLPSGWTLRKSVIWYDGLFVWTKTAAGSDTLATTLNASNLPMGCAIFEFAAGTTWGTSNSGVIAPTDTNPSIGGLSGDNVVFGVKSMNHSSSAFTMSGKWDGANVEVFDLDVPNSATAGYWLGIAYQDDYTDPIYRPGCVTVVPDQPWAEAITFALGTTEASYDHAWTGSDPSNVTDGENYELGTWFTATDGTELVGIRIYNPGIQNPGTNAAAQRRLATLWTHSGGVGNAPGIARTIDVPEILPAGWSEHFFDTTLTTSGSYSSYCVSYHVNGGTTLGESDYATVAGAFTSPVVHSPITFPADAGKYGVFAVPQNHPNQTFGGAFYGVDVLYAVEVATVYEHAWDGTDPTESDDTTGYEMGTYFTLSASTTLHGIRIWNPGLVNSLSNYTVNRLATLWTHNGSGGSAAVVATIDIPDLMATGWSEHLFTTPYEATTGVNYCVSYWVRGVGDAADYGVVTGVFTGGSITSGPFVLESGRYTAGSPAQAQICSTSSTSFYGVDVLYTTEEAPAGVVLSGLTRSPLVLR